MSSPMKALGTDPLPPLKKEVDEDVLPLAVAIAESAISARDGHPHSGPYTWVAITAITNT